MTTLRVFALFLCVAALSACAKDNLSEPPMPLGDFALGLNVVVADNVQMVPISRKATPEEWEAAIREAVDDRFGAARYSGSRLYNIGIAVDGFALAPPGIPVVAAPKSVVVITANIWDDGAQKKLNDEGAQFTVFEGLSGDTVIGSGLTRSKQQQMEVLAFNAVRRVEEWLLDHPEWFDMTPEELAAALAEREAAMKADPAADTPDQPPPDLPPADPAEAPPETAVTQ